MDIVDRINKLRRLGSVVSSKELANTCGVSAGQMSRYLNKKSKMPYNIAGGCLDHLGYSLMVVMK